MTFGSWGEETAAEYLITKGYKIVERNYRCKIGEIDIVAYDGNVLVFIEVKARSNMKFGLPCEAITNTKLRHIKRTISYYTVINNIEDVDIRIDAVEILVKEGVTFIHHIENIF